MRKTALYRLAYGPMGVEHQIAFALRAPADRVLAVALGRRNPDFSDEERDLLDTARPFLIQAHLTATFHSSSLQVRGPHGSRPEASGAELTFELRGKGLTGCEAEVVTWLAQGGSPAAIAA